MPSLFAQYKLEREGKHTLEYDFGFATYEIDHVKGICYIEDIFVLPEFREMKKGKTLADEVSNIARSKGCKTLLGSVVPSANGSQSSLESLLRYGFRLFSAKENMIYFIKDLI